MMTKRLACRDNNYESVARDWGDAFGSFNATSKKKKWSWKDYLSPLYRIIDDKMDGYILHKFALYHYGRIQEADLYAHFSPVEFIMDEKILKHDDFCDALGDTSIWERIKTLGKDRFYRVEYKSDEKEDEVSSEDKRIKEKKYVEKEGVNFVVDTSIADNNYVKTVIKAFVGGDKDAEENLYHEPEKVNL